VIIDCHCHAGRGDGLTGPWDSAQPLDRYLRRARAAGIAKTIVFGAFHSDSRAINRQVASIVAALPERLLGFAVLHASRDRGRIGALVDEAAGDLGLQGLKVHRHDAPITAEVCEAARARRLPVLYDIVGDTGSVEMLARDYPEVPFIIPHLGSFADEWRAQVALIDQMARHANIFADSSGVRRFDLLVEAVRRAGPEKLLFGSDGPWLHPGLELAKVRALGLSPGDFARVAGGNIARLLSGAPGAESGRPGRGRRSSFDLRASRPTASPPRRRDPWPFASGWPGP
jgi:hypothetical protein